MDEVVVGWSKNGSFSWTGKSCTKIVFVGNDMPEMASNTEDLLLD